MATTGYSFTELSRLADIDFKRIGVPVGMIMPYYGVNSPAGFLPLDGRKISKDAYPDLYNHLLTMRVAKSTIENFNSEGNPWAVDDLGRYLTRKGDTENVWRADFKESIAPVDGRPTCKAKYTLVKGSGTLSGTLAVDLYRKLGDIELSNAIYLEDARGQFLRGYDSRDSRMFMTCQGDAIRNITGGVKSTNNSEPIFSEESLVFSGAFHSELNVSVNQPRMDVQPASQCVDFRFDASSAVPTANENHPSNLNPLWVIKAYDIVTDPEALAAKVVIDQMADLERRVAALEAKP